MLLSLYDAIVPNWLQQLRSSQRLLGMAEEWGEAQGIAERELLTSRLAQDMLPLAYQFKSCFEHSAGAITQCRQGTFSPSLERPPFTYFELNAKLETAIAELEALDPEALGLLADNDVGLVLREGRFEFTVQDFLISFSTPNLYFHATTAHDILRMRGMPIGKRDFLGPWRTKN